MYTPVNPSFTIYKWGLWISKFYRYIFVMDWNHLDVSEVRAETADGFRKAVPKWD